MLDNSTMTLCIGVTMLFLAITGMIVARLLSRIGKLEDALEMHKHQMDIKLSEKAIDIYDTLEKSVSGMQKAVNDTNSKLIDVMFSRFDSIDLRIDRVEKDLPQKKVTKPRKPQATKAPKEEMLKS